MLNDQSVVTSKRFIEVGCGSGAICISLLKQLPLVSSAVSSTVCVLYMCFHIVQFSKTCIYSCCFVRIYDVNDVHCSLQGNVAFYCVILLYTMFHPDLRALGG